MAQHHGGPGRPVNGGNAAATIYYGWIIVGACSLILLASFGIYYSFSVFFSSLQTEFMWTRARTSSLFSVYLICSGMFSIICGQALDRFGPRWVVILMGIITGLSLLCISRVTAAWQMYLFYSVLLALGTGPMYIMAMGTASRWFTKKRGLALGIIGASAGLGTVIFSPFSAWMITTFHWRQAYLAIGMIAMAMIVPAGLLLRYAPGAADEPREQQTADPQPQQRPPPGESGGYTLHQVVATTNFRLFFCIWFCYSFCLHLVMAHTVPRAEDIGMSPIRAAALLSALTIAVIPARLLSGFFADQLDKRRLFIVLALVQLVVLGWLAAADRPWMIFVFAVCYGISYGAIDPPVIALVGDAFGLTRLGSIMGLLMVAWGMGSAAGPFLAGLIFDITGAYTIAFLTAGFLMALAAILGLKITLESHS